VLNNAEVAASTTKSHTTDVADGHRPAELVQKWPVEGDVIVEIVDSTIDDIQDYQAAIDRYRERSKNIAILIRRGDLTSYVTVDPRAD